MSKVIVLVGSMQKDGNTELLAEAFAKGASFHNEVEIISVADYHVNPCTGCNTCFTSADHRCCQNDDMSRIYAKLHDTDVLAIASPVYFYGISAQLKAIVDRLHNPIRDEFRIKKLALLLVGGASLPDLFDSIQKQYQMTMRFFSLEDAGQVLVRSCRNHGDVKKTDALEQAFELGKSIE